MRDAEPVVHSADPVDQASEIEAQFLEAALEKQRRQANQKRPKDFEGFCECGNEVPKGRINLNYFNCVECQRALEIRSKMRR